MAEFTRNDVVHRLWQDLEPELAHQGYELVEVEYLQQSGAWVLRLFIDREGGVSLDDCRKISQAVSPLLDVAGFIDGRYVLEVSSPGFDRPVRKPADFERFAGERIRVVSLAPVHGRTQFRGRLQGLCDGLVLVDCDGTVHEIHVENVKKAHLVR
jgi:ribosome maturation factor RimP